MYRNVINLGNTSFAPFSIICMNLLAELLLNIDTIWAFLNIVSLMRNNFSKLRVHRYILRQNFKMLILTNNMECPGLANR